MKRHLLPVTASFVCSLLLLSKLSAQCNVNEKYDKIISGYHSSIALKSNGNYAVWGSYMQKTGNTDQLAPQDINSTNYTGLTGNILKAALGGNKSSGAVDQGILLTTDGLWAWGVEGSVLNNSLTSSSVFARITSPSGAAATGLPSGITPDSVANLVATYQTLFILTKGGNVWILTQTTLAVEGNGGTVSSAGSSTWKQVKINASTYLQQVIAVRGQVSNTSYNAFMALTASGQLYTWGNSVYLGDGVTAAAKNYATLMTQPSGFSGVAKIIGVTGGIGTTSTTKNTYYLLANNGNMYSLGDNTQRQCGDFTTVEKTSWIRIQKSVTAGDYLAGINNFSCQEHNSSYPGVAAINSSGVLYTWGNNSSGMLSRTSDNTISGSATSVTAYDPGVAVGFSGVAVSVEVGGHTMVYLKEGSDRFCYAGHQVQGSMGDGTTTGAGSTSSASLIHTCSSTPQLQVCGYVPVSASAVNSVISVSQSVIAANGASTSTVTIRLKDAAGNFLSSSGGVVIIYTTAGSIGMVTDYNNGTYTALLTSSSNQETANISFSINGTMASNGSLVSFTGTLPIQWGAVKAYRKYKTQQVEWITEKEENVAFFTVERSINGSEWVTILSAIPPSNANYAHSYYQSDNEYIPGAVFYRISETSADGKKTYSSVQLVEADAGYNRIIAYPSPAEKGFYLGNTDKTKLISVSLFSISGELVRNWNQPQEFYNIFDLQPGIYIIKVLSKDNLVQNIRIKKI